MYTCTSGVCEAHACTSQVSIVVSIVPQKVPTYDTKTMQPGKVPTLTKCPPTLALRIWVNWLRGYKEWVPGSRAVAAATASDAALAAGHSAEGAAAAAESAAKALAGAVIFVTASATLMVQVGGRGVSP